MDAKKTGGFISALRKEKGYTQATLAEILSVSNRTVSKWENGDGYPDITILPDIAKALGVTVDELLAGERAPKEIVADFKITEIKNKDNLVNFFKICHVIALFFGIFAALLGTVTEIYCIWAFPILFYTHWEIMFVAAALVASVAAGLVFAVGVTRLGISYNKSEIIDIAGKKGLLLSVVLVAFPLSFIARIIDFSSLWFLTPYVMAALIIAIAIIVKKAYGRLTNKLSKGKSVLKIILLTIGIILLLWYLAPLAALILNIGNAVGIVCSALIILFGFYCNKMPVGWRNGILIFVAVFFAVVVIPLSFNMARYANYKSNEGAQTVIVLGCKVNGTSPSKYLYDRCKTAAEYLNENPDAVAILSGGQGSDEAISEAQCMENVLVEMGIDKSRLYLEDKSTNTLENIAYSNKVIEENGLSTDVLVVTNEFHEYRAKLICDKAGLNFHSSCSRSSFYTFLTYYTRELMGIAKELVFKSNLPEVG